MVNGRTVYFSAVRQTVTLWGNGQWITDAERGDLWALSHWLSIVKSLVKRLHMRERELKYHLITLGCAKNKVDSDGIEMLLRQAAYQPTVAEREADVLIVNTCG
ncbi:MAG: hypothetical protein KDE31_26010, partial [Caldilineaceae bacterium]|nr:hypothetical protein [Caldilineaceae bacterium]